MTAGCNALDKFLRAPVCTNKRGTAELTAFLTHQKCYSSGTQSYLFWSPGAQCKKKVGPIVNSVSSEQQTLEGKDTRKGVLR